MSKKLKRILLLSGLLLGISCNLFTLNRTPAVKATPNGAVPLPSAAVKTAKATPTTPAAQSSPTTRPTSKPLSPSQTPPASSLNPAGPYVVFRGQTGIWIANPDGSFATQISKYESDADLRTAISPGGERIALIAKTSQGLDLVIVQIPGGQSQTVAHLIKITRDEEVGNPTGPRAFATYAIRDYPNVAWQPGSGRLLAFTGAINGPTSDLYVVDTQTQAVKQLTNGPSQAVEPSWSPDGQYILHAGVSWVEPLGGAIGPANRLDGIWSVQVSDGKVITLPKPEGNLAHFKGWLDDRHYMTFDSNETCISQKLRSVDVVSGKSTPVMDASFDYQIARDPLSGAMMFASHQGCATSLGDGVFLLQPGQSVPARVWDIKAYEIYWMPESNVFNAYPEGLFSPDGKTHYETPVYESSFNPAISINGYQAWQVIENRKGRVVVKVPGKDWQNVLEGFVSLILWDPVDGKTLLVAMEDGTLYRASYPDFKPESLGYMGGVVDQAVWLNK